MMKHRLFIIWAAIVALSLLYLTPGHAGLVDDLIAYYSFDGGTATNLSAHGATLNGTVGPGVTSGTGILGQAVFFPGVRNFPNNSIQVADQPLLDITDYITLSAWIKTTSTDRQVIVSKMALGNNTYLMEVFFNRANLVLSIPGQPLGFFPNLQPPDINTGDWVHVVGTYDGVNRKIYVNGTLTNTKPTTGTIETNEVPLIIGDWQSAGRPFNGGIDEVGIWSRALSAAEVEELYNDGAGFNPAAGIAPANQPPVADAGSDQTVECASASGAEVTLDGAGSSDPDDDPLTYTWTDSSGAALATGATPTVTLPLGTHVITLTVSDGQETATDQVVITVEDTTPPSITAGPSQSLWPPNHKYVTINVEDFVIAVDDACAGSLDVGTVVIESVSSDEPENGQGDGNTLNDIVIAPDGKSVQLRAERQGSGNGRVYTINIAVKDPSGNVADAAYQVTVPKSQNGAAAVDDGPVYTVISGVTPKRVTAGPDGFSLAQNHPNPFNPATDISYELPRASHVRLVIYNVLGQEVRSLVNALQSTGFHTVRWDGRDRSGRAVSSGIYLYRIQAGDFYKTRRMLLLK